MPRQLSVRILSSQNPVSGFAATVPGTGVPGTVPGTGVLGTVRVRVSIVKAGGLGRGLGSDSGFNSSRVSQLSGRTFLTPCALFEWCARSLLRSDLFLARKSMVL